MAPRSAPTDSLSRARERAGVRAGALRQSSTDAERALWLELRDRRLGGRKFRRQHPIDGFFADFASVEAKLVVEVDGGQHFEVETVRADQVRTRTIERHGFTVLRFDNRQVLTERGAGLQTIHEWLVSHDPHPNPLPQAGEGAEDKETP